MAIIPITGLDPSPTSNNSPVIQAAIDLATTGDTIEIPPGSWRVRPRTLDTIPFPGAPGGRPGLRPCVFLKAGVNVKGIGQAELRFDEPMDPVRYRSIFYQKDGYVEVDNLRFCGSMLAPGTESTDHGVYVSGGSSFIFNCKFDGFRGKAIFGYGRDHVISIDEMRIVDCRFTRGYGQAAGVNYCKKSSILSNVVEGNLNHDPATRMYGAEAFILKGIKELFVDTLRVREWGSALGLDTLGLEGVIVTVNDVDAQWNPIVMNHLTRKPSMATLRRTTLDFRGDPRPSIQPLVWCGDYVSIEDTTIHGGGTLNNISVRATNMASTEGLSITRSVGGRTAFVIDNA